MMSRLGQFGLIGRVVTMDGQRDHDFLARFEIGLIHGEVLALVGMNAEFQEPADSRVAANPLERGTVGIEHHYRLVLFGQDRIEGYLCPRAPSARMLQRIDEVELVSGFYPVFAEVD